MNQNNIKPQELRIGNWVSVYGEFKQVESVGTYGISFKDGFCKYTLPNFKPIPLSEEVLLKAGFERKSFLTEGVVIEIVYYKKDNIIVFLLSNFFEIEIITSAGQFNIHKSFKKELHVLQNAIHALTGKELEVSWT